MDKQAKHKRMQRAAYRSMQRNKDVMWQRLSGTEPIPKADELVLGYKADANWNGSASFYAPYMPILSNPQGIIGDCSA